MADESKKSRISPAYYPNAGSLRHLALLLPLLFLFAGCGTTTTYKPNTAAGPAKPADYPIPVYNGSTRIPRPCQLIGEFSIGDTSLTVSGGSLKGVMKTLMDTAREKGADVVQITSLLKPDFDSAHYRLEANLLRYSDTWEKVTLTENDFLTYLRQHAQTLDPIEGIWFDGSPDRIGIIRDNSKPGRDFIGFSLNPQLTSWQKGYKRMDIARGQRPGAYNLKYYRSDFEEADTSLLMARNGSLTFFIRSGDDAYAVTLLKIGSPMPAN
jgi:hypothetical protein